MSGLALILAAFAGSLLSVGFILILSRRLRHMAVLLVAGIMIGYICSAVTDFVITFARESDIVNLHGWSQGSFSGMTWQNVGAASAMVAVGVLAVFGMAKPIGAYQLGEGYARSMGVNIKVFRTALIVLSSLLSACVTAFAGPISFVGIAVPHLTKRFLNTAKPIVVIPAMFLGGAVFCMLCDLIARTAFAPTELNISTVTSVFGAPVVIAMMLQAAEGKGGMNVENYLQTRNLCVGYDGVPLIRDIALSVRRGEIVALIGPNGAGKSTILKSITRQLKRISGVIEIGGAELRSLSARKLATQMAVVLTDRLKPEMMTCRDVVAAGRYPYTGRMGLLSHEDEEKVTAAMAAVHAVDLGDRDFGAISDGQRQRILLARALCQEPEVLVLDEPTSFLDIRHKLELLSILRGMAREKNLAVVLSLHEIDLAQKLADRVVCVKGDTIARFGPPEEIFREEVIRELYDVDKGAFDPLFGSVELERPEGEVRTMVLAGGGCGIHVFRALQRQNRPFAAGVLYENDVDFRVARLLAADVVTEQPFLPISDAAFARAAEWIDRCDTVIDAGVRAVGTNARMAELIELARSRGKALQLRQQRTIRRCVWHCLFRHLRHADSSIYLQ